MRDILSLYEKETFDLVDTNQIEALIEQGELTTEVIFEAFKTFSQVKGIVASFDDFEEFKEHFENLATHSQNYKTFENFLEITCTV